MDGNGIDGLLEQATRERVLPGVVAVAGDRDRVLYEGAFGRLSVDGDAPVARDTVVRLASITKAITSVAALQLIEQGGLDLEQPVADVIPAFGELPVLEASTGTRRGCVQRCASDNPQPAHAHLGVVVLVRQRRRAALPRAHRHPRSDHRPARRI